MSLSGIIVERHRMRFTPAGAPVCEALLRHVSNIDEAGKARRVELEISVLAVGASAKWLDMAELGKPVEVSGFIAQKSLRSKHLILHLNSLKYLEGN